MENKKNESLRKNLDELIRLFKKVNNKNIFEDMPGIDKSFFKNFELLVNNYDFIKNDLSDELLTQFGEPIHKMISDTVKQLKNKLKESGGLDEEFEIEENTPKILITPEPLNIEKEIKQIDDMLKRREIKAEEVDRLLDRRSELQQKILAKNE
jgi:hypothetical protein